jgi:crossover junction endodeoxyribonuclease RuvC
MLLRQSTARQRVALSAPVLPRYGPRLEPTMQHAQVGTRVILGIDPGTLRMGWGILVLEGTTVRHRAHGVLRPAARDDRPRRLGALLRGLEALMDAHRPDLVAVETAFVRRDPRAALALGEARGVALAIAAARELEIREVSPSETKRAVVGGGRATKEQVQEMVRLQLALAEVPPEDAADALAAALTAARTAALDAATLVGASRAAPRLPDPPMSMTASRAYYAQVVAAARGTKRRKG